MTDPVRVAVVGTGNHARNNIFPSLYRLPDAELVAVCDLNEIAANEVAAQYRIPGVFTNVEDMLRAQPVDAAIISTGPAGHAVLSQQLMRAGVDVYTEKPTASSLAEALQMLETSRETGRICMTAFKKRFAPAYVKARSIVESPEFGEKGVLNVIRTAGRNNKIDPAGRRRTLDWSCHTFDLSAYLWGRVRKVTTTRSPATDRAGWSVVMQHEGGGVSHQLLTFYPEYHKESLYLCGTGGIDVQIDNSISLLATHAGHPIDAHWPAFTNGLYFSDIEQGFAGELVEFVSAVRDQRRPLTSIEDGAHSLAIFEAFWESAESGQPVEVAFP